MSARPQAQSAPDAAKPNGAGRRWVVEATESDADQAIDDFDAFARAWCWPLAAIWGRG